MDLKQNILIFTTDIIMAICNTLLLAWASTKKVRSTSSKRDSFLKGKKGERPNQGSRSASILLSSSLK